MPLGFTRLQGNGLAPPHEPLCFLQPWWWPRFGPVTTNDGRPLWALPALLARSLAHPPKRGRFPGAFVVLVFLSRIRTDRTFLSE